MMGISIVVRNERVGFFGLNTIRATLRFYDDVRCATTLRPAESC